MAPFVFFVVAMLTLLGLAGWLLYQVFAEHPGVDYLFCSNGRGR